MGLRRRPGARGARKLGIDEPLRRCSEAMAWVIVDPAAPSTSHAKAWNEFSSTNPNVKDECCGANRSACDHADLRCGQRAHGPPFNAAFAARRTGIERDDGLAERQPLRPVSPAGAIRARRDGARRRVSDGAERRCTRTASRRPATRRSASRCNGPPAGGVSHAARSAGASYLCSLRGVDIGAENNTAMGRVPDAAEWSGARGIEDAAAANASTLDALLAELREACGGAPALLDSGADQAAPGRAPADVHRTGRVGSGRADRAPRNLTACLAARAATGPSARTNQDGFTANFRGMAPAPHQRRLAVGIDLGTTNSLVAAVRNSVPEVLPDETGRVLLRRWSAISRRAADASAEAKSRPPPIRATRSCRSSASWAAARPRSKARRTRRTKSMRRAWCESVPSTACPVEVSAEILATLRYRAEDSLGDDSLVGAVITVPRISTKRNARRPRMPRARLAGNLALRLLNEPTAGDRLRSRQRGRRALCGV